MWGCISNQYKTVYHWFDVILLSGLKVKMFLKRKRKRKRNRNQYVLCRSLLYWIVLSSYSTLSCDCRTLNPSSTSLQKHSFWSEFNHFSVIHVSKQKCFFICQKNQNYPNLWEKNIETKQFFLFKDYGATYCCCVHC